MSKQGKAEQIGTDEGNRIIAESPFVSDEVKTCIDHYKDSGNELGLEEYLSGLDFSSSWDLLMPVVEKIGRIPSISIQLESFTVEHGDRTVSVCFIERTYWPKHGVCEKEKICFRKEFIDKLPFIENVWGGVVEFIKWDKQQSPNP